MDTKLTLTIEKYLIEKAKIYAKKKGRSLSDLIEACLTLLTKSEVNKSLEMTLLVTSLKESFRTPSDFDYKKILKYEIFKRHL